MFASSDGGPRELKMKQIKNWAGSETDKSSADYHPPKKIKFPLGVSLISACYANDEEEFKQLLGMGIDIDTRNPDGMTCVHQCCINGDYEFLEFLIKEGADINVQDNEGWTPLHAAASVGREEMVRLLLDNGADVSLLSCEMELPVDVSQSDSVTDLLNEAMRTRGIDPVVARQTEEQLLLRDVKQMLESGKYEPIIDPRTGATPLHVAACKDYLSVLEMLLKIPGVDLNSQDHDGWTALHAAAHWNREASIRLLAEAGASFDLYTLANQSVFDVADRQVVVLLRQLRERQRSGKKAAAPPTVPLTTTAATAVDQLPKSAEAIKRGHPSESESSEDSEDSEETSENDERASIMVNKKPALDSEVTTSSVAAGDHSTLVSSSMNDMLATLMNDHRPAVVACEKMAGVEENSQSDIPSVLNKTPSVIRQPFTKSVTPPPASQMLSTDQENGVASVVLDFKEKISEVSAETCKSSSPVPPPVIHPLKEDNEGEKSRRPVFEVNGVTENREPFPTSEHKLPTKDPLTTRNSVPSVAPRRSEDRLHDNHVRLRSPPARPTPTPQSPSPPPTPARSTEIRAGSPTLASSSAGERLPASRSTRIVTIRKRISTDSSVSSEGDSAINSPTSATPTSVTTIQSSSITTTSSSSPSSLTEPVSAVSAALLKRPDSTRSPSPLSSDDFHGNRRVSFVMAPAKSGETETQRSVKARYVRSTRRSTQGVSAEELEQAKRLIDYNNNSAAVSTPSTVEVPPSSANTAANSQPREQKQPLQLQQQQKSNDNPSDTSLRPRLDRPTVHVARTGSPAIRSSVPQSPADSDSIARRKPTGDEALSNRYGTDDTLHDHRGNRQEEADERVKSAVQITPSSDNNYFSFGDVSSRLSSTKEDGPGSRISSTSDSPSKGARDQSFRDRLVEATEHLEREQLLNRRRIGQRQNASSPTSPLVTPSTTLGNTNSTSTGITSAADPGVKPIVSRPCSRFLHVNDSSASTAPVANSSADGSGTTSVGTGSGYAWSGSSYGANRSGGTTAAGNAGVISQSQCSNPSTTSDSRYGGDSRSTYRSYPYQDTVDYRRLYEQEKINRERLQKQLDDTLRELSRVRIQLASFTQADSNSSIATANNSTVHHNTTTEELNRLREENMKMKEENGALIRVISKLSRPL